MQGWQCLQTVASSESKLVIYGAIGANVLIAAAKFVAASVTGSSAMISEGIHSAVDAANGGLLLLGVKRSLKPADGTHPFGYGKELYFWSFLVSIIIFGLGGGMSLYEGVMHLRHPSALSDPTWNYAVLAISFVFEAVIWVMAFRHFQNTRPKGLTAMETIRRSKDPTQFLILFEDTAAIIGVVIAAAGIAIGHAMGNPYVDGVASILIGLVLAGVAVILAVETKGLLLGESADRTQTESIQRIAAADPAVEHAGSALTMHFAPDNVLLNLSIHFRRDLSITDLEAAIARLEQNIRTAHPQVQHIFIEAESLKVRATDSEIGLRGLQREAGIHSQDHDS